MDEKKYTLVSLFSGAGGLDMGFENKGFNVVVSILVLSQEYEYE